MGNDNIIKFKVPQCFSTNCKAWLLPDLIADWLDVDSTMWRFQQTFFIFDDSYLSVFEGLLYKQNTCCVANDDI